MSNDNWYRNADWTAGIEAEFERKIARTRTQKAQYLMLQGQALVARHPEVAIGLLKRSIACNEPFHLAQAHTQQAMAYLALGQVDDALIAYEGAIEAQLEHPFVQTSAPLDYAFAVAWFGRAERYPIALAICEATVPSVFPGADLQKLAAHALILAAQGDTDAARSMAVMALEDFPDIDGEDACWAGISFHDLHRKLEALAG